VADHHSPKLAFSLTVDFDGAGYWIGSTGPFHYGAAVTAFFCGGDLADNIGDGLLLMRALEDVLRVDLSSPDMREREASAELFLCPEKGRAECSVCFAFHPIAEDTGAIVERYTFSCLRDFLYVELGKAIEKDNAPCQCRLCGRWFLHARGTWQCTVSVLFPALFFVYSVSIFAPHLYSVRR